LWSPGWRERQPYLEATARPIVARADPAVVRFDESPCDGQAEPRPCWLVTKPLLGAGRAASEGDIEDSIDLVRGDVHLQ
jgi:hypothetical protein